MEIKKEKSRIYGVFMVTGAACAMIIFAYHQVDWACRNMVVSESILAAVSCLAVVRARHEYKSGSRPLAHWAMLAALLFWIAILPVRMLTGLGVDSFLHTRLLAYGTMELFAMAQVMAIAVMLQRLAIRQTAG